MTPRHGQFGSAAVAAVLALTALASPMGAAAQIETHSRAPIDITADQAEVIQSKCEAVWKGAAEAIQDKSRLRADTITVYSQVKSRGGAASDGAPKSPDQASSSCGPTERIVADGHVYYVTPDRNARGDHAVYTQADDQIVMTGDVIVVQGQDVARGERLIIDVASHQATMASPQSEGGRPGRVRGVYFPEDKASPAGPPATAAAPAPAAPQRP